MVASVVQTLLHKERGGKRRRHHEEVFHEYMHMAVRASLFE